MKLRNKERLRRAKETRLLLLKLRAEGDNMKSAAYKLGLTDSNAEHHWAKLREEIGVFDFALMVQWALYNGVAEWKVKPEQVAA